MDKYLIITPVKDEANYIDNTLQSVVNQSLLPQSWIIVDDGSTDNTVEIIKQYCKKNDWITCVENKNTNEKRSGGIKVVRAFYKGYDLVKNKNEYDFVVKLDGDLSLPLDYFEKVAYEFTQDKKLGICGGYILNEIENKLIREVSDDYHIRGAFKAIKKECFKDINGFKQIWNWDGIDEMDAMFKGWKTKVIDIPVIHHRPTTQAYNKLKHSFMSGVDAYQCRNNLLLFNLRFFSRLFNKPIILNSIFYGAGYFYGIFSKKDKYLNKDLGIFINKFHIRRIIKKIRNL